jgi:hypothetical protein
MRLGRVLVGSSLLAAALSLAGPSRAADGPWVRGPYLQDLSSRHVAVLLELQAAHALKLEVRREPAGPDAGAPIAVSAKQDTVHELLVEGLEPATSYAYTVTLDDNTTERGTFTTAPEDGRPFSFLLYGDNRSNPYAHAAVVSAMRKAPADFLVNTGDMVQDGARPADWLAFFSIERELLRERCLFPSIGNHEIALPTSDGALRYARMFRVPAPPDAAERWYTFRWSSARFYVLDAQDEFASGERAWLEKTLEATKSEAGVLFRFVVLHHGPFSSGLHGPNEALLFARVPELLRSAKVDVIFSGHDHAYERGEVDGSKYVVSGGGGAPLYRENRASKGSQKFEATWHFGRVAIDGPKATFMATRHDGSTLDACTFTAGGGAWSCGDAPQAKASAPSLQPAAAAPAPEKPKSQCGCSIVGSGAEWLPLTVAGLLAAAVALRPRGRR